VFLDYLFFELLCYALIFFVLSDALEIVSDRVD
jgi:hypothetical protein